MQQFRRFVVVEFVSLSVKVAVEAQFEGREPVPIAERAAGLPAESCCPVPVNEDLIDVIDVLVHGADDVGNACGICNELAQRIGVGRRGGVDNFGIADLLVLHDPGVREPAQLSGNGWLSQTEPACKFTAICGRVEEHLGENLRLGLRPKDRKECWGWRWHTLSMHIFSQMTMNAYRRS